MSKLHDIELSEIEKETNLPSKDNTVGSQDEKMQISVTQRQISETQSQLSVTSQSQISITSITENQISTIESQTSVISQRQISASQSMHEKIPPEKEDEIKNADTEQNDDSTKIKRNKDSEAMVLIKKKVGYMGLISFFLISFGLTAAILWPSLFNDILSEQLILTPNSTSFRMWKETPVPMYLKIYMYNWTNYDEVSKNVKPHFVEMGPYVFREVDYKVNMQWNMPKNGTLTFQQKRMWYFEPTLSNGKLTDEVTNLNPVAATLAYMMRYKKEIIKIFITSILNSVETIAITKPVHQLLFDGYDDRLLSLAAELDLKNIPFDRFAYFYKRNASETYDGKFVMNTGKNNTNKLGIIEEWHSNNSAHFPTKCGEAKGTNGDLWPPLSNIETVSVLSPDVCDTVSLKADGQSEWLGIIGSKYSSHSDMFEDLFENGTRISKRKCHCQGVECQPSGSMNVSTCKFGAPAFISLPHFYLADPSYRQNISGMKPNKKDHEFELIVQPNTGIPMRVRAALQLNFLVKPDDTLKYFKNLPHMYVPMIWFTQEVNLTSEYANQVKLVLILLPAVSGILYSIGAIGILLVIIAIFLYFRQRMRDEENQSLVPKDSQNREGSEIVINNEE